jgi:hypothetical protein
MYSRTILIKLPLTTLGNVGKKYLNFNKHYRGGTVKSTFSLTIDGTTIEKYFGPDAPAD